MNDGDPRPLDPRPLDPGFLDPRGGDLEDDASSTKSRSMLSLAGTLLSEISLPRLLVAFVLLLLVPGLLLGAAPIAASALAFKLRSQASYAVAGVWSAVLFGLLLALGWFGWRPLFRAAERSFWSLNALLVQPTYIAFREGLRHVLEARLPPGAAVSRRESLRAWSPAVSGALVSVLAMLAIVGVWPHMHLLSGIPDAGSLHELATVVLANSVAIIAAYLAVAAIAWAIADVTMAPPRDLAAFGERQDHDRTWRVAHLSDIHVVGERYGFRIESGRLGPQGNGRWHALLARLAAIHAAQPLDLIVITGDMTDAGRSAEWAEFQDALDAYPTLAARTLMLPGNHDVNIVDRANPARLDLPTSPNPRLRQLRTLAAMAALQGDRVRVIDPARGGLGASLSAFVAPHRAAMERFMATGAPRWSRVLPDLWNGAFPMVLPPGTPDGLGVILLNSNAITHFSFTNALGMISAEQARGLGVALSAYPQARWIVALHHHALEYPRPAEALSERIGTALINGNWFVRRLLPFADRVVVMHGHRHIDWIGGCAGLRIVSAPSPVMAPEGVPTSFYVHTLAAGPAGRLELLAPERLEIGATSFGTERTAPGRSALFDGAAST